jgi:hypothetical protein
MTFLPPLAGSQTAIVMAIGVLVLVSVVCMRRREWPSASHFFTVGASVVGIYAGYDLIQFGWTMKDDEHTLRGVWLTVVGCALILEGFKHLWVQVFKQRATGKVA